LSICVLEIDRSVVELADRGHDRQPHSSTARVWLIDACESTQHFVRGGMRDAGTVVAHRPEHRFIRCIDMNINVAVFRASGGRARTDQAPHRVQPHRQRQTPVR
jgi:hypothetical protein